MLTQQVVSQGSAWWLTACSSLSLTTRLQNIDVVISHINHAVLCFIAIIAIITYF